MIFENRLRQPRTHYKSAHHCQHTLLVSLRSRKYFSYSTAVSSVGPTGLTYSQAASSSHCLFERFSNISLLPLSLSLSLPPSLFLSPTSAARSSRNKSKQISKTKADRHRPHDLRYSPSWFHLQRNLFNDLLKNKSRKIKITLNVSEMNRQISQSPSIFFCKSYLLDHVLVIDHNIK